MPASRNPFFTRTAEQSESDDQFLNLFSQNVLELLPEDGSWNRLLPIESPPGGGKSTLLRLFTPTVLTSIANARNRPELSKLVQKLSDIGAIDSGGVQILGVLVNCKEDYNRLAGLDQSGTKHDSLFWALLHSRLALLTLRASLQLTGFSYPNDVDRIRFSPRSDSVIRRPDPREFAGSEIFERARYAEQLIVDSLNSFVPQPPSLDIGTHVDDFFQLLNTHHIMVNNRRPTKHVLLMFDDAHFLDDWQRTQLRQELERHDQVNFASWMSMRLRALEPPALVSEAVQPNREGFRPLRLDRLRPAQIEPWLLDIGDRRALRAQRDVSSFSACLSDSLESEFENSVLEAAAQFERHRVYELVQPYGILYQDWLDYWEAEIEGLAPIEQAVRWAQFQILIERRIQNPQSEFVFEPLPASLVKDGGTDIMEIANMFMANRNGLPYMFGAKRVAQLASSNVDQFLSLSAALFDLLLNSGSLGRRRHRLLAPTAQHRLILGESQAYFDGLKTSLPYGQEIYNLAASIADLCRRESQRPNVPIAPGVTGISIQISDRDALVEAAQAPGSQERRLLNTLASAIAHNVISLRLTDRNKDENRAVLYLNRLICPAFSLPLGYGGYKPQRVADLLHWIDGSPSSPQMGFELGRSI